MNLAHFLDMAATKHSEKTAVICEENKMSFRELKAKADKLAAALLQLGIARGAKVAILSRNSIEFVEIIFALLKIGAIGVPLNYRLTKQEIQPLIEHSEAEALFFEAALQDHIPPHLYGIKHVISINGKHPSATTQYERLFDGASASCPLPLITEHDPSFIIYTAGTTGKPKGVVFTHGNQIWNTINYSAALEMTPLDIELAPTPLFHASTLGRIFTYVFNGVTFILCKQFNPAHCLDIIHREQATSITQAPTMYQMMLDLFDDGKWNTYTVKRAVTGAAPMPVKLKNRLKDLFPYARLFDLYGLTEAGPGISILTPENFYSKISSVGTPMLSVELTIADESKRILPSGEVGEIICRSPALMQGYYKDPKASAAYIQNGWLHTGDLGWIDDDRFLYIVGRKKDIVISGGENVYPGEIEAILGQHPAVADVACIGVEDAVWGEKVVAVVVLEKTAVCTKEEIINYCKRHLSGFKCPRTVFFVEQLPRNAAQKVIKEDIKKQYQNR